MTLRRGPRCPSQCERRLSPQSVGRACHRSTDHALADPCEPPHVPESKVLRTTSENDRGTPVVDGGYRGGQTQAQRFGQTREAVVEHENVHRPAGAAMRPTTNCWDRLSRPTDALASRPMSASRCQRRVWCRCHRLPGARTPPPQPATVAATCRPPTARRPTCAARRPRRSMRRGQGRRGRPLAGRVSPTRTRTRVDFPRPPSDDPVHLAAQNRQIDVDQLCRSTAGCNRP